jgi:integrase
MVMRGSIYWEKRDLPPSEKHPKGRVRYYLFSEINGHRQAHGGHNTLRDVRAAARIGKPEPENLMVTQYYDRWWKSMEPRLQGGAVKAYASAFRLYILPYFKKMRMAEVTPRHIQDFLNSLNRLSPGYVRTIYSYCRSFFNSAVPGDVIHVTPCRGIKLRKIRKPQKKYYGPTDVWKLIDHLTDPYDTMFSTLALSGIRIGECLGLTVKSIDFEAGFIRIDQTWDSNERSMHLPKTESSLRSVEMISCLGEILAKYMEKHGLEDPDALLFPATIKTHEPRPYGTVNGMYIKALKRLAAP